MPNIVTRIVSVGSWPFLNLLISRTWRLFSASSSEANSERLMSLLMFFSRNLDEWHSLKHLALTFVPSILFIRDI